MKRQKLYILIVSADSGVLHNRSWQKTHHHPTSPPTLVQVWQRQPHFLITTSTCLFPTFLSTYPVQMSLHLYVLMTPVVQIFLLFSCYTECVHRIELWAIHFFKYFHKNIYIYKLILPCPLKIYIWMCFFFKTTNIWMFYLLIVMLF